MSWELRLEREEREPGGRREVEDGRKEEGSKTLGCSASSDRAGTKERMEERKKETAR